MAAHPAYSLRRALWADRAFLWELKVRTLKAYITQTFGWDELIATAFLVKGLPGTQLILVDGQSAGRLCVVQREGEVYLAEIGLMPEHQNRGLGAAIIGDVIADADRRGLPVALQVMKVNPAKGLYERLGFDVYADGGTHWKMRRAATAPDR